MMKKEKVLEYNQNSHKMIHEVVENQIKEGKPKETLDRSMNLGYSRHEAIHKIGTAVIYNIYICLKTSKNLIKNSLLKNC